MTQFRVYWVFGEPKSCPNDSSMLRHILLGSTKIRIKKTFQCMRWLCFLSLSSKLGPICKVPCSINFLLVLLFFCTDQIQALIWATGDYFVLPWRLIFKYWVLYHELLTSRRMQRALHHVNLRHMLKSNTVPVDKSPYFHRIYLSSFSFSLLSSAG